MKALRTNKNLIWIKLSAYIAVSVFLYLNLAWTDTSYISQKPEAIKQLEEKKLANKSETSNEGFKMACVGRYLIECIERNHSIETVSDFYRRILKHEKIPEGLDIDMSELTVIPSQSRIDLVGKEYTLSFLDADLPGTDKLYEIPGTKIKLHLYRHLLLYERLSLKYRYWFNTGPRLERNDEKRLVLIDVGDLTEEQLKIINTELSRNSENDKKLYGFFTSTEGLNVGEKIEGLTNISDKCFTVNYNEFSDPNNLIEIAKRKYETITKTGITEDSIRILIPESNKSRWQEFLELVSFLNGKLYIDTFQMRQVVESAGLRGELKKDSQGRYFDLSEETPAYSIEQADLLKRIMEDEV